MNWNEDPCGGIRLKCSQCSRMVGKWGVIEKMVCPDCRTLLDGIDKILGSFDYVREIGRGEDNHIGIELTVSIGDKPKPNDKQSRADIKQFLMDAILRDLLTGKDA